MDELCSSSSCAVWCGARMDPDWRASLIHVVSSSLCSTLLFFTVLYSTSRHVTLWYITCSALLKTTRLLSAPLRFFLFRFVSLFLFVFFFFLFLFFSLPDSAISPSILTSCSSHTEACNALGATEGITSLTTITCTLTTTTCTL